ncbi:hypothetical protein, partial [Shigella sonnei]|uniref:hypothetical protein n=2 Tax=Shigella sonnei TaxID=624 RepID=UPI0020A646CD
FCSLLAPSDAILFQEGVSVKLRLPQGLATRMNRNGFPVIISPQMKSKKRKMKCDRLKINSTRTANRRREHPAIRLARITALTVAR